MSWGRPNSIRQLVNWLTSTVTGGGSRQPCRVIAYAGSPVTLQSSPITNAVFSMAPAVKPRIFLSDQSSDRALQEASIEETVIAQLNRARTVQAEWAESRMRDRIAVLKSLRLRIAQDPRGLARSVNRENAAETLAAEVLPLLDACRFLELERLRNSCGEKSVGQSCPAHVAVGNARGPATGTARRVVLIIAPSNYPLMLPGNSGSAGGRRRQCGADQASRRWHGCGAGKLD
jgi:acyl-CoA reductase-like NAD-dependent aldehyde dehydrogenase